MTSSPAPPLTLLLIARATAPDFAQGLADLDVMTTGGGP
jgi:hypothetical protein